MIFYVLIRENLEVPENDINRKLPIYCHWNKEYLESMVTKDSKTKWYIEKAQTAKS